MVRKIVTILLILLSAHTFVYGSFASAMKSRKLLSPDEAFHLTTRQNDTGVDVVLTMAPKVHIYKNALKFDIVSPTKATLHPTLPPAIEKEGEKVYEGTLKVHIPQAQIDAKVKGVYTLQVSFQGCSDAGICYQPISKRFDLKASEAGFFYKISSALNEGNAGKIADLISKENGFFIVLLFFIFGILLALTPCVFPMIPILSSIIVSQQKGSENPSVARALFISSVYVLAMASTYTVVGIVAGLVGADIQTAMQNPWVLGAFAAIFVALALSLFGYYEIGLPASWQSKLNRASDEAGQKGGVIGTAIMGLLSALIVGPCVAPPLAGAVLFISHTGDALLGGTALFAMSVGMGLPLLLVGIGAGKFMPKPGGWMTVVSQAFGVMMLALAIFMLSRFLPHSVTLILWSLLFMGTAIYMGVFENKAGEGAMKLFRLLAMVFLIYGISLFVGALAGATSMLHPFEPFTSPKAVALSDKEDLSASRGYSIARLLKEVKASDKPVVVDFGKESCTSCKELEEVTFKDPKVKEALKHFTFIKVDVTENTPEERALLKKYELFGTPNIIFFDKYGKFMPDKSLTGYIGPKEFAEHLKEVEERINSEK